MPAATAASDDRQARLEQLQTMPVGRLLWQYSLPAVVGMLVMMLYNVVDRIFISQVVGPEAIAGLAITFPVMNITTALGTLVGAGASARVSLLLGAGKAETARKVLGNSLTLTLTIGIIYIGLFAAFMDTVLRWFGANEITLPYARDFMTFILPGLLLTNLTFSFNNIMRASGFPVRAMVTMFIGAGLNVVLAPTFIYLLDAGIKGAAIATDIAMAISAIFVMRHFTDRRNGDVTFAPGIYRLDRKLVWAIMGIGAAPFVVNTGSCIINIFINHALLDYGGVAAIAASGIFVTFTSLLCCVILGICQGMQPIVGFNYGCNQTERVARVYWLAVAVATVISLGGWIIGLTCPQVVARAFVSDPGLVDFTAKALSTAMICFWMVGFQIVSTTYFQAIGKIGKSVFLSLIRQVIFFIPLLLLLPKWFGLNGVWFTFWSSDILATLVTAIMMAGALRSLRRHRAGSVIPSA